MKGKTEFEKAISAYLEEAKKTFPNMSEALMKEGKTLTDCCNFIVDQVKKMKVNVMTPGEVFELANKYYLDEKIGKVNSTNCRVVVASDDISDVKVEKPKQVKAPKEVHPNQMSIFDLIENEA